MEPETNPQIAKKKPGRPRDPRPVVPETIRLNAPSTSPAQEVQPELNWEGERLRICMPVYRDVHPYTMKAVFAIAKKHTGKVGFDSTFGDATAVARNMLTARFLKSEAEWLLFIDDDMIPPIGHAGQMKAWGANFPPQFENQEVITRLVSQKKNVISAVCFDRYGKGVPRYKEAMENPKEAEYARSGPHNVVKEVEWVGAGCILINRVVLQDIAKAENWNIQSETPLPFFGNLEGMGEDVSFCVRAKKAGHPIHLDMGCICGHAGAVVHWK